MQYSRYPDLSHTLTLSAGVEEQMYHVKLSGRDKEGTIVLKPSPSS